MFRSTVSKVILFTLAAIGWAGLAHAQAGSISTGFDGAHETRGAFVDVTPTRNMQITGFALHMNAVPATIDVYTKPGATTSATASDPTAWTLLTTVEIDGNGPGVGTGINIPAVSINAGDTVAFYLVSDQDGKMLVSNSPVTSASNADVTIEGNFESHGLFTSVFAGWGFLGTVCYDGGDCGAAASIPPLPVPFTSGLWVLLLLSALMLLMARKSLTSRFN